MRSAGQLVVDQRVHAAEITRFHGHVVCGPTASDCNIWTSAIGADGYGQLYLTRERSGLCVRPHRYALAIVSGVVAAGVLGLHECDNRVRQDLGGNKTPSARRSGPQGDNIERMARMRRGGGRYALRRLDGRGIRRERSATLREAVRHGGDAALLGDQATLW
ncbi:hypothetical protein EB72_21600 [Mycobacterium sp. SWH-M1]|nr:hypothetical protein EB72_21600 [Mycobacterium sp. SWH-M1]